MRLRGYFRGALYAVIALLFVSGLGWLAIDWLKDSASWGELGQEISAKLLMVHGAAAMVFLLLMGVLTTRHVQPSWRIGRNRISGAIMAASNAVLIVTAYGLYYVGSDTLRRWTSDIHIIIGLGLPAFLALHLFLGKRRRSVAFL